MKVTVKTGVLLALGWMVLRLLFFYTGWSDRSITPTILLNMLFLLLAVSVGLYLHKKQEGFSQGNALSDIKAAMTSGIPYALLVGVFIYFYYAKIDTEFVNRQIAEKEMAIQLTLEDPEQLSQLRQQQEGFEMMTTDQIRKEMSKSTHAFYAPGSTMTISLLGMTLLATLYSILITVIYRRVLFRGVGQ